MLAKSNPLMGGLTIEFLYKTLIQSALACISFHVKEGAHHNGSIWNFNGDVEKPTFTPSLLVNDHYPASRCHLFMIDGKIQFLADCHHELAGQTVDMVPIDV